MTDPSARTEALPQKVSYCPFGCAAGDLDELGYCRHLVGFTDDGVTLEPVRPLVRRVGKGADAFDLDTGYKQVVGGAHRQPVLATDRRVNPEVRQLTDGVWRMARRWVSERVYREADADAELERLTRPAGAKE